MWVGWSPMFPSDSRAPESLRRSTSSSLSEDSQAVTTIETIFNMIMDKTPASRFRSETASLSLGPRLRESSTGDVGGGRLWRNNTLSVCRRQQETKEEKLSKPGGCRCANGKGDQHLPTLGFRYLFRQVDSAGNYSKAMLWEMSTNAATKRFVVTIDVCTTHR